MRSLLSVLLLLGCNEMSPSDGEGEPDAGAGRVTKVGQTATLSQRAHGVKGTATIVDERTIELTDFSYDGGGIDVRIYGGLGGNYRDGFAIGMNLLGTPYTDGTLRVELPAGVTLDDLDGVSVWCVAASASFGDGLFAP